MGTINNFNIENIMQFNNFLDINFIKDIKKEIYENAHEPKWKNSLYWEPSIRKSSTIVSILEVKDIFKNKIKDKFIFLFPELINKEITVNYYLWPNLSFIPFHNDWKKYMAATIYLSEEWNKDYGGLFLYENNKEIKAIVPEFNKCIVNNLKVVHGTSLTTIDAPYRETLQIFFT